MIPSRLIERKRDGGALASEELQGFLDAYLDGDVADYQMAAFLMAVHFEGLDATETETLVSAMVGSGASLDLAGLPGPRIDKHSTGGVGDKVSLALAPLAAEMGLYVPMMSGRGLGHTTGTLDKLDAIPGFRTQLELGEFTAILERVGCAMIGQTPDIAPLDRRLYALRDVTGTVPVIPLIAASIMSKKLAEDLTGLLLDVKVGGGAFIPEEARALDLARTMVDIGAARGLPVHALLTAMDRPLGRAVGNALETAEALACLRGEGPDDLRDLVVAQVVEMVRAAGDDDPGVPLRVEAALASGRALERFGRMVEAQGGDARVVERPDVLPTAPFRRDVTSDRAGRVAAVDPRALGEGNVTLGGGRRRMEDVVDLAVGFEVDVRPGQRMTTGDRLGVVHARSEEDLDAGAAILKAAIRYGEAAGMRPLISHRVTAAGTEPLGRA